MEKELIYLGRHCGYIAENKVRNEPNIGVVFTDTQTLLIDAGSSIAHFQRISTALEREKIQPPKQIVLTHYHWDHTFATSYYEAYLYAQNLTAAKLEQMHTWRFNEENLIKQQAEGHFSAWSSQMIRDYVPDRNHLVVKRADIVFNDEQIFEIGDIQATAIHVGGSHTNDSSVVYVPSDKVLFLGDSLYSSRGVYNKATLWPMLAIIRTLDVEYALLSHREPFTRSEFQDHLNAFESINTLIGDITSHKQAHDKFIQTYNRKPTPDEFYILRGLVKKT